MIRETLTEQRGSTPETTSRVIIYHGYGQWNRGLGCSTQLVPGFIVSSLVHQFHFRFLRSDFVHQLVIFYFGVATLWCFMSWILSLCFIFSRQNFLVIFYFLEIFFEVFITLNFFKWKFWTTFNFFIALVSE